MILPWWKLGPDRKDVWGAYNCSKASGHKRSSQIKSGYYCSSASGMFSYVAHASSNTLRSS